jgi:hydrogenase maturation protease
MKGDAATLVLGLGNTLLSDEGVGVHVVRAMVAGCEQDDATAGGSPIHPPVRYVDGGTLSFTLAPAIESAERLVVVDAADIGGAPGTIRVFENEEMDRFLGSGACRSVHEVALRDLLAIALVEERLPERRALVGIQPERCDWGVAPTAAVAAAIPHACAAVTRLVGRWTVEHCAGALHAEGPLEMAPEAVP